MAHMSKTVVFLGSLFLCSQLLAGAPPQSTEARLTAIEEALAAKNRVLPEITADNVFFADASYIFWRAYEDGLDFANLSGQTASGATTTKSEPLSFEWNSGFKVGIGYRMPHDFWELAATWTRLHSKASGSISSKETGDLSTSLLTSNTPDSLSGNLHIHLNMIDGGLARFFQATPHLGLKPQIGVRGLIISQQYTVASQGGTINDDTTLAGPASNHTDFQSKAVGLQAGLNAFWQFCKEWSIYTNVGGSLLASSFSLSNTIETSEEGADPFFVFNKESIHVTLVPTLDLALGIGYEHSFDGKAALGIRAGWEFNDFFSQNKMTSFLLGDQRAPVVTYSNDLTYQGLTVNIRLDF